jgi:hypothetical protein
LTLLSSIRAAQHLDYPNEGTKLFYIIKERHVGTAATTAEQRKTSDFTRREQNFSAPLARDGLPAWECRLELRPFALDMYGALGTSSWQVGQQLAQCHGGASSTTVATYMWLALQTNSVALQSTKARMIQSGARLHHS